MFGGLGMLLFLVLLSMGLAMQQGALVALGGMGALTLALSWVWYRLCLERLTYVRRFMATRAFAGEELAFAVEVKNGKPLPLPRVRVEDDFPEGVEMTAGVLKPSARPSVFTLSHATALSWYESVRWDYRIRSRRRGYYRFGPAVIHSGDLFGFFSATAYEPQVHHLLVYPRVVPLPELGLPVRHPYGDQKYRSWLYQDPTRFVGVRDYQPGDPLKQVDWKASARAQGLKVRELEASARQNLIVVLNLDTLGIAWRGYSGLYLERGVTVAASVGYDALGQGETVGLLTNGTSLIYERPMSMLPARDPRQHLLLFETLAMVGPYLSGSIEEVLERHRSRLPTGATLVLVTGVLSPTLVLTLREYQRAGHAVQVLYVADEPPEAMVPVTIPFWDISGYFREKEASGDWEP